MVKIRLQRYGSKKRPFYRIVVADSRAPRDGRFIEILGSYDPTDYAGTVQVKGDRVSYWMEKGAQPTQTANSLLRKAGAIAQA